MNTKFIHICFSSYSEVMFRDHEDYIRGINNLVIASVKTGTNILAYAFMSNHVHCCIQTKENPMELHRIFKSSYGRYFSAKYGRKGDIGDLEVKIVNIDGYQHCLTAISYCLRNPLHHGVTNSSFNYPYSSVLAYFRDSLGRGPFPETSLSFPRRVAPQHFTWPKEIQFESDGRASLETTVDYKQVEMLFKTPGEFIYNMIIRKSGKKWREEQKCEEDGQPITLELLESDYYIVKEMEKNERYNYKVTETSDISICTIVDDDLVPKFDVKSVYFLSTEQQLAIGRHLHSMYSCSIAQIARCLAVRDDSFYRLFYR